MEPNYTPTAESPADYGFEITPSNSVDLVRVTRAIYATGAGVIKWHNRAGDEQHAVAAAGQIIPIRARRVLATGTTATGLVGLA